MICIRCGGPCVWEYIDKTDFALKCNRCLDSKIMSIIDLFISKSFVEMEGYMKYHATRLAKWMLDLIELNMLYPAKQNKDYVDPAYHHVLDWSFFSVSATGIIKYSRLVNFVAMDMLELAARATGKMDEFKEIMFGPNPPKFLEIHVGDIITCYKSKSLLELAGTTYDEWLTKMHQKMRANEKYYRSMIKLLPPELRTEMIGLGLLKPTRNNRREEPEIEKSTNYIGFGRIRAYMFNQLDFILKDIGHCISGESYSSSLFNSKRFLESAKELPIVEKLLELVNAFRDALMTVIPIVNDARTDWIDVGFEDDEQEDIRESQEESDIICNIAFKHLKRIVEIAQLEFNRRIRLEVKYCIDDLLLYVLMLRACTRINGNPDHGLSFDDLNIHRRGIQTEDDNIVIPIDLVPSTDIERPVDYFIVDQDVSLFTWRDIDISVPFDLPTYNLATPSECVIGYRAKIIRPCVTNIWESMGQVQLKNAMIKRLLKWGRTVLGGSTAISIIRGEEPTGDYDLFTVESPEVITDFFAKYDYYPDTRQVEGYNHWIVHMRFYPNGRGNDRDIMSNEEIAEFNERPNKLIDNMNPMVRDFSSGLFSVVSPEEDAEPRLGGIVNFDIFVGDSTVFHNEIATEDDIDYIDVTFCQRGSAPYTNSDCLEFIRMNTDLSISKTALLYHEGNVEAVSLYPEHVAFGKFHFAISEEAKYDQFVALSMLRRREKYKAKGFAYVANVGSEMYLEVKTLAIAMKRNLRHAKNIVECLKENRKTVLVRNDFDSENFLEKLHLNNYTKLYLSVFLDKIQMKLADHFDCPLNPQFYEYLGIDSKFLEEHPNFFDSIFDSHYELS